MRLAFALLVFAAGLAAAPRTVSLDSSARGKTGQFAAGELTGFLSRLGDKWTTAPDGGTILLKIERRPGSGAGGFTLAPRRGSLDISGVDEAGLLYGVYHFLEMQGFRWYAPGQMGEVAPAPHPVRFPPAAVTERPRYLTRGFFAWEPRGRREFHVWMARNRFNYWTAADSDHDLLQTLQIRLNAGSHWVFERFLNPARYFETHPEWFGLHQGRRQKFFGITGVNLCTSNPAMMAQLNRNMIADLATGEWKDVSILELWALDVGKWCECDNCRALGTPTDRMLKMTHDVRKALDAARAEGALNRQVTIFFPVYAETLPAPTRPLPEGFDYANNVGTLFPIHRCYVHTLDDPDCQETNAPIWKTITGWEQGERFYKGEFVMGEYYNVSTTKSLPVLYTAVMPRDVRMYAARGIRHFHYMHVPTSLQGPKRLNDYLLGRLLWKPDVDVKALVAEYLRDFYGPAAGPMAELYQRLEHAMSPIHHWKSDRQRLVRLLSQDADPLFPLQHLQLSGVRQGVNAGVSLQTSVEELKKCRAIMNKVLAGADGMLRRRLDEDDRNLRYAENTVNLIYLIAKALLARRGGNVEEARRLYAAAAPLVDALKAEKELVQSSASHANAPDGFEASLLPAAWKQLGEKLK